MAVGGGDGEGLGGGLTGGQELGGRVGDGVGVADRAGCSGAAVIGVQQHKRATERAAGLDGAVAERVGEVDIAEVDGDGGGEVRGRGVLGDGAVGEGGDGGGVVGAGDRHREAGRVRRGAVDIRLQHRVGEGLHHGLAGCQCIGPAGIDHVAAIGVERDRGTGQRGRGDRGTQCAAGPARHAQRVADSRAIVGQDVASGHSVFRDGGAVVDGRDGLERDFADLGRAGARGVDGAVAVEVDADRGEACAEADSAEVRQRQVAHAGVQRETERTDVILAQTGSANFDADVIAAVVAHEAGHGRAIAQVDHGVIALLHLGQAGGGRGCQGSEQALVGQVEEQAAQVAQCRTGSVDLRDAEGDRAIRICGDGDLQERLGAGRCGRVIDQEGHRIQGHGVPLLTLFPTQAWLLKVNKS